MAGVLSRREFTVVMAGGIAALMPGDAETGAPPPGTFKATLTVNGQSHELTLDPRVTLLDLVREHLRLTGPKKGCDHGQCGACTMIVDGRRINSCLTLAVSVDGARITTIEGLETGGEPHPMQVAFPEHDGFQCGFCTPGQICSAVAIWDEANAEGLHDLSADEIRERMSGNISRCGAYPNIVDAVLAARPGTADARFHL